MQVDAIGTVERLSREVVLSEPGEPPKAVLLVMDCDLDDACTFTYDSLQMRGDGGSFTLKFKPTAGFTYRFHAQRGRGGAQAASRLQVVIYPPEAVGAGASGEELTAQMAEMFGAPGAQAGGPRCAAAGGFGGGAEDVGEIRLGSFLAPADGRPTWAAVHGCEGSEAANVGPPEAPCGGTYRQYPGQDFGDSGEWEWTCPYTGEYSPGR